MIDYYLSSTINEVYELIGGVRMKYYYIPYIEHGYKESKDYIVYDYKNKIKINATINSSQGGDVDIEYAKQYLKNTMEGSTIQFTLDSIYPHIPRKLDRVQIEFADGSKKDYLIVGIDNGMLLQGLYASVRVFEFDGTLTKFQWVDNEES